MTFVPLIFPTGRLPSTRWRPVAYLALALLACGGLTSAFQPGRVLDSQIPIPNPLGVAQLAVVFDVVNLVTPPLAMAVVLAGAVSVLMRFRRATVDERQQIKWFAYAATWIVVVGAAGALLAVLQVPWSEQVAFWLYPLSVVPLPIAIGVAILKHRLYDIDLLVNRTIVYGALTAGLALAPAPVWSGRCGAIAWS